MNTLSKNSESSKFKPVPHFIAYLDILGYEEKVSNGDYKLAEIIDSILNSVMDMAKRHTRHFINTDIKVKAFSDNILICAEKGWDLLFMIVGYLQSHLIENGYFIRGALCHSELRFDERFVFGQGIIMAHKLESKIAKFPRIILHSSYKKAANASPGPYDEMLFDVFTAVAGKLPMYLYDDDGYMFLNYLEGMCQMWVEPEKHSLDDALEYHRGQIIQNIEDCENRCLPRAVMEKYLWCLQYHNRFCRENDYNEYMAL